MQLSDAIHLIDTAVIDKTHPARWADLGCGDGVFTKALASLLHPGSTVYAVDQTPQRIISPAGAASIQFILSDFEKETLSLPALDGILMANSLHYVKDKDRLLDKLSSYFTAKGSFLIVEYDTTRANRWVPYPVTVASLQMLFANHGFEEFKVTGRKKSVYGQGEMVACFIH